MLASAATFTGVKVVAKATAKTTVAKRAACVTRAGQYDDELLETAVRATTRRGRGDGAVMRARRARDGAMRARVVGKNIFASNARARGGGGGARATGEGGAPARWRDRIGLFGRG